MLLAVFLLLCAGILPVQLFLCFRSRRKAVRLIPVLAVLMFTLGCALAALPENLWDLTPDGRLAAVIALFLGLFALAGDGLAWLIWAFVHVIQKRRK